MDFCILGPLEVSEGGRPLRLGGPQQRAVLALLLLRANEVVSSERLVDELWGEAPPESAKTVLQGYVSSLRKLLEPGRSAGAPYEVLVSKAPGYLLRVGPEELDLHRFERLLGLGRRALSEGDPSLASESLREALALWRGPALADLAGESFARPVIARLEELRLTALEERVEADLALGRDAELVPELEALVSAQPLRERLKAQLMLALYRSGRQAHALEAYREARRTLIEELGIEPGPALQQLERAILRQDPALDLVPGEPAWNRPARAGSHLPIPERSILVAPQSSESLDTLVALAVPLARATPPRELILARLAAPAELPAASALVHERRAALLAAGLHVRAAVFTSPAPGEDVARLASEQQADLVLLDSPRAMLEEGLRAGEVAAVLDAAPCDVAILLGREGDAPFGSPARPVLVLFGGTEHDWAALELGAWVAGAHGLALRLAGVAADLERGGRDASRLLARASLLTQRMLGVAAEPLLVAPETQALIGAADEASLLVVGVSARWRQEGLAAVRLAVAREARPPTLLVHRGLRPGGLAPGESMTRFTWTLAGVPVS